VNRNCLRRALRGSFGPLKDPAAKQRASQRYRHQRKRMHDSLSLLCRLTQGCPGKVSEPGAAAEAATTSCVPLGRVGTRKWGSDADRASDAEQHLRLQQQQGVGFLQCAEQIFWRAKRALRIAPPGVSPEILPPNGISAAQRLRVIVFLPISATVRNRHRATTPCSDQPSAKGQKIPSTARRLTETGVPAGIVARSRSYPRRSAMLSFMRLRLVVFLCCKTTAA
jgi:hypothetical protein